MNVLIFAMASFLFLLFIDICTSTQVIEPDESQDRDIIGNREIGDA